MDLAQWILEHAALVRIAKENKVAQSSRPGSNHPSTILNEAQKVELNAGVFIGQLTLDVNMYRGAAKH